MDADANLVLFEKDADTLVPPASMSKLMTLAVVFRELKAGRLKLEDQFKVSEHAWRTGGAPSGSSAMFAPLNSMVSVSRSDPGHHRSVGQRCRDHSRRGHCRHRGGLRQGDERNMRARSGLTQVDTSSIRPGLPAEGHVMTARELAMLARYLIYTYPEYYHFFGEKEFKYLDKYTFHNRNPLDLRTRSRRRRAEDRLYRGGRLRTRGQRQARRPAPDPRRQWSGIEARARRRAAQADRVGLQELQAVPAVRSGSRR